MAPMPGFLSLLSSSRSMSVRNEYGTQGVEWLTKRAIRTSDIVIEDVIFFDGIVDELLGRIVDHQDHPL